MIPTYPEPREPRSFRERVKLSQTICLSSVLRERRRREADLLRRLADRLEEEAP